MELRRAHAAALRVQASVRGHQQRRRFRQQLAAVGTLQAGVRRWQARLPVSGHASRACAQLSAQGARDVCRLSACVPMLPQRAQTSSHVCADCGLTQILTFFLKTCLGRAAVQARGQARGGAQGARGGRGGRRGRARARGAQGGRGQGDRGRQVCGHPGRVRAGCGRRARCGAPVPASPCPGALLRAGCGVLLTRLMPYR